jgi:hypothetical protein
LGPAVAKAARDPIQSSAMRWLVLWLVTAFTIGLLAGCGRSLRALPDQNQIPIGDDRGILEKRGQVAVLVRPRSVPWEHDRRLTAFSAEITNFRAEPLAVSSDRFILVDEEQNERRALDPVELERAFDAAVADTTEGVPRRLRGALAWGVKHRRHYRYCRPRHYRRYYYHTYPYYGRWYFRCEPYPYYRYWYYDSGYDEQLAQERIAQFLAELWRERELAPNEVMTGHVVFAYRAHKDATVTLRLELDPPGHAEPAGTSALPEESAVPADSPLRFEFRFEVK